MSATKDSWPPSVSPPSLEKDKAFLLLSLLSIELKRHNRLESQWDILGDENLLWHQFLILLSWETQCQLSCPDTAVSLYTSRFWSHPPCPSQFWSCQPFSGQFQSYPPSQFWSRPSPFIGCEWADPIKADQPTLKPAGQLWNGLGHESGFNILT